MKYTLRSAIVLCAVALAWPAPAQLRPSTGSGGSPTLLSNSMAVVNGTQSLTNAGRVIYIETNQPVEAIIEAATAGTTIILGVGTNIVTGSINVPHGVSITGHGDKSVIHSTAASTLVVIPGSDGSLTDFAISVGNRSTLVSPIGTVPTGKAFTNVFISRIKFWSETDFIYIEHASPCRNVVIRDCFGDSKWDVLAVSSNAFHQVDMAGCHFNIDQSGATHATITSGGSEVAPVRWTGGEITIRNCHWNYTNIVATTLPKMIWDDRADAGALVMQNCTMNLDTSVQWTRFKGTGTNKRYLLENLSINGRQVGPHLNVAFYTAGNYTNTYGERVALHPNGSIRTNTLPDAGQLGGGVYSGQTIHVVDDGHTASGTNIQFRTHHGQLIDGSSTMPVINTDGGARTFMVRGTNWITIGLAP